MKLDEFDERRPPAPRPYIPTGAELCVPGDAVAATFRLLSAAGSLESCVFWYGPRDGGDGTVSVVRAPVQSSTRFNYHVDEAAMSGMVATLPPGVRPLAQIHSHPGRGVEHSRYDDEMTNSRRALSLVFPEYGRVPDAWLDGIGVHEWQDDYWHLLASAAATARVRLAEGDVDVRDLR